MTKRDGLIFGTVAAAGVVVLFGGMAVRKRGSGTEVSMGPVRQPKPEGRKTPLGERFMHNAEMPTVGEWKG